MTTTPAGTRRTTGVILSLVIVALALCALAPGAWTAWAQSGRRKTDPARQSPAPTPTPSAEPRGESESQPRGASKKQGVVATFVVYEDENLMLDFSITSQRDIVGATFFDRLRQSPAVEVARGGKASRKEARDRAKSESAAYVVLLQLEEDMMSSRTSGSGQVGRADPSNLAIRLYVYAPGSGDLKYNDLVTQRPYRSTTSIGGVRLPVPVGRERYPGEYQLAQAARDAADRLLARFDIMRPPDN